MQADILAWTVPLVLGGFSLLFVLIYRRVGTALHAAAGYGVLALAFALDIPQLPNHQVAKALAGDGLYIMGTALLTVAVARRYGRPAHGVALTLFSAASLGVVALALLGPLGVWGELLVSHLTCGLLLLFAATRVDGRVRRQGVDSALFLIMALSAVTLGLLSLSIAMTPRGDLTFTSWRTSDAAFALQLASTLLGSAFAVALLLAEGLDLVSKLSRDAASDPLTGLLNRRGLEDAVAGTVRLLGETRDAVLVIDLDHFKSVNDRFGHAAGDGVLAGLAEILRYSIGERMVAARLGGEEFAVLCFNTPLGEATVLAERLRRTIEMTRWPVPLHEQTLTASVGVVEIQEGEGLGDAIHRADRHLYVAKASGRNRVVSALRDVPVDAARRRSARVA
ncbi:GGDEF domain-containing protein [Aureimonas jatrophae]|uniref:diguanylate cyclase n=1 Tax=Aureimonas jatrophae TaxID=1166073 RepID=A0A1H0BZG4_9HYPH|nr:GGDEF domain-containing protein [Aureimonas jatrophae]MBB3949001.1 diguanylate cyclase (GGDEF)-like protein [Aureimonas jatrophae]SDN51024.1 diguanylate cyclase (GGDEF) domain-containing protein [Aureimonas jatrophae]